jgi:hypothetical protein
MEPNGQTTVLKNRKIIFPLISLVLFGFFILCALHPKSFDLGFKRQKTYRFNEDLGFFKGDINSLMSPSHHEAEKQMIELFPKAIQKKVKNVIRPAMILCEKHQLDPFWVLSVMWTESHFKSEATSRKGARGLMQVMPSTHLETIEEMNKDGIVLEASRSEDYLRYHYDQVFYDLGHSQLVSTLENLEVGIYYLKRQLMAFDYNHYYATVSYNMGPGWTRNQLRNNLPVGQKNHYLNKVLKHYYRITKTLSQNPNVTFIP